MERHRSRTCGIIRQCSRPLSGPTRDQGSLKRIPGERELFWNKYYRCCPGVSVLGRVQQGAKLQATLLASAAPLDTRTPFFIIVVRSYQVCLSSTIYSYRANMIVPNHHTRDHEHERLCGREWHV